MSTIQPEGYLAKPASGTGAGVLVLHAWWGLNDTIKAFCRRLADEGFVVFAPDLHHGALADTIEEAEALVQALDGNFQRAKAEVRDAAHFLRQQTGQGDQAIAVVAFSMGVYFALDLAAAEPDRIHAVIIFYGSGDADYSNARARYLGHFAENDPYEPVENIVALGRALEDAELSATFHVYPGTGHWFFEPDRTDAYDEEAASLAWERTLAFLQDAS